MDFPRRLAKWIMTQFFLSSNLSISRVPTATIINVETLKICFTAPNNHLYNLFSIHEKISVQYIDGCLVHRGGGGDIMSISGHITKGISKIYQLERE